ncbi:unnamed protein product [Bemisia tabaci]|uniref:Uncharacterized protein n=1 Tax=Bemisia tabaci TaxID=7038 RepID=A0A9P0EZJ9_BEMTA|nr:unnamed protein product [Bemisia tabaci]
MSPPCQWNISLVLQSICCSGVFLYTEKKYGLYRRIVRFGLRGRKFQAADHEDDTASVTSVGSDAKSREWMIQSARSEYQTLAKLAAENPRLVRFKGIESPLLVKYDSAMQIMIETEHCYVVESAVDLVSAVCFGIIFIYFKSLLVGRTLWNSPQRQRSSSRLV